MTTGEARVCPTCKQTTDQFSKTSSICRTCVTNNQRKYRAKIGKKEAARKMAEWRAKKGVEYNKERNREALKRLHEKINAMTPGERKEYYKKLNNRQKQKYLFLKDKVYKHYGAMCNCCGETEIDFLTIDHIHNNGNEHRKEIGSQSSALVRWIISNDYPDDFQILCWNCQWGKKKNNGICPHIKKEKS